MDLPRVELSPDGPHPPQPLIESLVKACFLQTVHNLLSGNSSDPEGCLIHFSGGAQRDEEILALLAIATNLAASPLTALFPTSLEALASLPEIDRTAICQVFREALETSSGSHAAA